MSEEINSHGMESAMEMDANESNKQNTTEVNQPAGKSNQKRKSIDLRSKAWDHFRRFQRDDGRWRAECHYCGNNYAADTSINGTSGLNAHLRVCKKYPPNMDKHKQQSILSYQSSTKRGKSTLTCWSFNQLEVRKAVAYMIIVDEQPFSIVDKIGFKHLLKVACPQFEMPSRSTITRDCYEYYVEERIKLKDYLKKATQRVSLTTDTWTSEQNINYMCLTAHFIDNDWNLQKRVLNFCPISSHKGEDIGKGVEKCLIDWGLIDQIFTVTVDNVSSNDTALGYLKRKFMLKGTCLLGGKYLHMRCISHIINLVVVEGLKEINESVARVRAAVRYVKLSPNRLKKFKDCVGWELIESKKLLSLDVPTRWNSTYLMLSTAAKLSKAFDRLELEDRDYKKDLERDGKPGLPTLYDWDSVGHYVQFLEHFYELTLEISGSLYVTSNVIVHELSDVLTLLDEWELSDDVSLSIMASRMRKKYDKYWGKIEKMNMVVYFAVVLDPRYKFKFVSWLVRKMFPAIDLVTLVKVELVNLFEEYVRLYGPQGSNDFQPPSELGCTSEQLAGKRLRKGKNRMEFKKLLQESEGVQSKSELDKYLEDKLVDDDEFEILKWWKKNEEIYPILAHMARDILAVPVSTVASESAFSVGGRILDSFRTSLTPKSVQALMCTRDWLRSPECPLNV